MAQEIDQEESWSFWYQVGSPIANSPPFNWLHFDSPVEQNSMQTINHPPGPRIMTPTTSNHLPVLASILQPQVSNTIKVAAIGNDLGRSSHGEHISTSKNSSYAATFQLYALPEPKIQPIFWCIILFCSINIKWIFTVETFFYGEANPLLGAYQTFSMAEIVFGHPFTSNGKNYAFPYSSQDGSFVGVTQHHHNPHVGLPYQVCTLVSIWSHMMLRSRIMLKAWVQAQITWLMWVDLLILTLLSQENISSNGSSNFRMRSSSRLSHVFWEMIFFLDCHLPLSRVWLTMLGIDG
ncbi:Protein MEI2-like 2, partial [Mucuna pruriens]